MTLFRRLIKKLHWLEDAILVFIFVSLVGLAFAQIVLRNFLGGGLLWADSALKMLVLWLAFWGAAIAAREKKHIRMELISHYLPPHWQHGLLAVVDLAAAVISALICWHSSRFVQSERLYGDIAFAGVPLWWCELVMPISFALLSLRFGLQFFTYCLQFVRESRS